MNIVTKSGTNGFHGEGLYLNRPGDMQAKSFSTKGFCPGSVPSCVTPTTLTSISPVDIPDALGQGSGSFGGPLIKDKTFSSSLRITRVRIERRSFRVRLPRSSCREWRPRLHGHYRQALVNTRLDHSSHRTRP